MKRAYVTHLMQRTCKVARYLVVPSAAFGEAFVARWGVPPQQVKVVYHGVEAARSSTFGPSDDHRRDELRQLGLEPGFILCVTNALPHKNVPRLLDAYRLLRSRGIDRPLVLAGNISPDALREWLRQDAHAEVYRDSIILTGFLPHGQVLALCRSAGVMATPTLAESSSMPVLEAMTSGCPVVASDIPVHREIAGSAARLVDPASSELLADALQQVLEEPAERGRLIAAGYKVAARFSWERTATEMVALFAQAAGVSGNDAAFTPLVD